MTSKHECRIAATILISMTVFLLAAGSMVEAWAINPVALVITLVSGGICAGTMYEERII